MASAKRGGKSLAMPQSRITADSLAASKQNFKFKYFYGEALRMKLAGDLPSAADNLYRCHLINPRAGAVFFELATISSAQQMYQSAVVYARRAVALNPSNVRYKRALAELLARADKYDEAIESYEALLKLDPKHAKNYYPQLATLYTVVKKYEKACAAWDKYAEVTELTASIVEEKFKLYVRADNKKKAFRQIDELIARFPDNYNYVSFKAEMYCALGDTLAAEKVFQKAFKDEKDNPSLQYVYANYVEGLGQNSLAGQYYYAVMDNPKASFDLKSAALLSLSIDSSVTVADTIYNRFITEYPDEYLPYFCRGLDLLEKNDTACYDFFKHSLALNPRQEDTWLQIATHYSSAGNVDSTSAVCEAALAHFPDNVDLHYLLGFAQKVMKHDSVAVAEWQKAIDLSLRQRKTVEAAAYMGLLGDYYHELGRCAEAFAAYDSALAYNPENVLVLNNYAYYLSLEKVDLQRAERMSGKTVKANPDSPVFLDTYAWICFQLGEYSMANLYIERAYNNGGSADPELLEHYGDILYKIGEGKDSYLPMWQKALEKRLQNTASPYKGLEKLKQKVQTESYVE